MAFGESYLTHMKVLENIGFLRIDEVAHKGGKIVPIEVLKTLLPDPASLASRTKGQTHIGCYMKGVKDGKNARFISIIFAITRLVIKKLMHKA